MVYPKPWKSCQEQLDQLIARGMRVTDEAKALEYLKRIGYYRLSGYWFAFRERSQECCLLDGNGRKPFKARVGNLVLDSYRSGATFHGAVDLYVFDKQLRLLAMDALERIEIALRADISHVLGRLDKFAYMKPEQFHVEFGEKLDKDSGVTLHHEWLGKHAQLISRSKEEFVRDNKSKYGLSLAIWVACEVWDFGTLSKLFAGMREADQDTIARQYGNGNGRIFASWLRSLNYLRNVCAHRSRLWNRNIVDQPRLPPAVEVSWTRDFEHNAHAKARCYLLLNLMRHLLWVINPDSSWPRRMRNHLKAFPNLEHIGLSVAGMGAQEGWEEQWQQAIKNPLAISSP